MDDKKNKDCCLPKNKRENSDGFWRGIIYAIIPHSFCVLFVALSVVGATFANQALRQFLMLPYFMPMIIGLSLLFASVSATFYLKRIDRLSIAGAIEKKKYLAILFSTTVIVNILFFNYVMPFIGGVRPVSNELVQAQVENKKSNSVPVNAFEETNPLARKVEEFNISVDLPCSGHAFLVTSDLEKLKGVESVDFYSSNKFKIKFDSSVVSKNQILAIDIFKTYKATEI